MKNVKLKILSAFVAASILIPVVSASADEASTSSTKLGLVKEQKEKLQEYKNSDGWQQHKTSIISKKDTIKQNYQTNKALREEITNKKITVEDLKNDLKKNKAQINEDDLSKIKAQLEIIKTDTSQLSDLKGDVKKDLQVLKDDLKTKNFDDTETQLDNIISIQNTRTNDLKKLSTDLDSLISLLQTLTSNSPSV